MGIRANHSRFQSRSLFGHRWLAIPRDYLERRRYFRKISNVLMIVLLSIIVAGFIIYTSNSGGFSSPAGH
jgi:hypothetical protein